MPAIWLAWAMAAFCVAILSYIWRTGSADDPDDGKHAPLSHGQALAVRTALTVIFGLGLIYFILVLRTFGTYGEGEVSDAEEGKRCVGVRRGMRWVAEVEMSARELVIWHKACWLQNELE